MRYLLSCHKKDTAGYFFDYQIAKQKRYRLFIVPPIAIRDLPLVLFRALKCGLFAAIASTRYEKALKDNEITDYAISRDICSLKLQEGASFIVVHNLESNYYYLEAKATANLFLKTANYLQAGYLKFRDELAHTKPAQRYYLSQVEYRYKRMRGDDVGTVFDVNFDQQLYVRKLKCGHLYYLNSAANTVKPYCYFGNFKNSRTLSDAKKLIKMDKDIVLFGYGRENLPAELLPNYRGFVEDIKGITTKYTLFIPDTFSKVGVQTKAIQWLAAGGNIVGPPRLKWRLSCR